MFKLGVIEESVVNTENVLDKLRPFFFSQRIENVPGDQEPIWHTNEYHVPDEEIEEITSFLAAEVKATWYIHAFSNDKLIVVLKDKVFIVSLLKNETWNEMIEYGVRFAQVELHFLENIPLHI